MVTFFKSESGKKEILALYNKKQNELPFETKEIQLDTSYGVTHILTTNQSKLPPLIIVHGSNGCAPVALEVYQQLSQSYNLIAVDVIAQPNKSAASRPSMKTLDYGIWMHEVIEQLQLRSVTLAGFSFGGLVILKTILHSEKNIKQVFLTAPAFIVNGNPIKALFKFFIPMKRFMKTEHPKYLHQFLDAAFTEKDQFAYEFLTSVLLHFTMDFAPVPTIKTQDALRITTPIHLFAAKNDIIFPGEKMIKRAKKIFPSLQHTMLLQNSKHVQNLEDNIKIQEYILSSQT